MLQRVSSVFALSSPNRLLCLLPSITYDGSCAQYADDDVQEVAKACKCIDLHLLASTNMFG